MQDWRLAPGISFCVSAGVPIFLDLARDRYVTLPERLRTPFLEWYGSPSCLLPAGLELLEEQGLVQRGGEGGPLEPVRIDKAERANLVSCAPGIWEAAPGVLFGHWRITSALRKGGIIGPLMAVAAKPPRPTCDEQSRLLAMQFTSAQRALSLRRNCLHNSLALLDFLRRRGADADIIFAVTSSPFRAHCWIQRGGWILNDAPDAIAPFTPILVR